MNDHQPCSKLVLHEISKEAIDKSTKVVDKNNTSTKVVDDAGTSDQSLPSQELRVPRRGGRVIK